MALSLKIFFSFNSFIFPSLFSNQRNQELMQNCYKISLVYRNNSDINFRMTFYLVTKMVSVVALFFLHFYDLALIYSRSCRLLFIKKSSNSSNSIHNPVTLMCVCSVCHGNCFCVSTEIFVTRWNEPVILLLFKAYFFHACLI